MLKGLTKEQQASMRPDGLPGRHLLLCVQEVRNRLLVDRGIMATGFDMFDGFDLVFGHVGDASAEITTRPLR